MTAAATASAGALARRAPVLVLTLAGVIALAGAAAAVGLDSEFSQREFMPADADRVQVLERLEDRFGGDVGEETLLLVEADFTEAETWQALAEVEESLTDVDGVATVGGRAEVVSPIALLTARTAAAAAVVEHAQQDLAHVVGGDAGEALRVLPDRLGPHDLPEPLRRELDAHPQEALEVEAGGAVAFEPEAAAPLLPAATDPTAAVVDRLFARELTGELQAAFAADRRARLGEVDPSQAAALIERDPRTITRGELEAAGYPMKELDQELLELLAEAEALHDAGWDGMTLAADADVDAPARTCGSGGCGR